MFEFGHTIWTGVVMGSAGPPVLAGASLDMNFASNAYFGALPSDLTVARAQTVPSYAETAFGTLASFAANAPRITNKGLLIEEARTNSAIRSQTFSGQINTNCTCVDNVITAPDGTLTASSQVGDGTSIAHYSQNGSGNISFTQGSTYAFSVYAKAGTGNFIQLTNSSAVSFTQNPFATFNLTTGAVTQSGGSTDFVTAYSQQMADGWWRCVLVITASGVGTNLNSIIIAQSQTGVDGRLPVFSPVLTVYLWGEQLELVTTVAVAPGLLYASSYIPTTTVAVLRNLDNVQLTGAVFTAVSNRRTGTIYGESVPAVGFSGTQSRRLAEVSNGNPNDRVFVGWATAAATGRAVVSSGGVLQADISGGSMAVGSLNKLACAWDEIAATGNANVAVNSALGTLDTAVVAPTALASLYFGSESTFGATSCWNGYIRRVALWTTRQSDAALQALTT